MIDEKFAALTLEFRSEVNTKETTYTALAEKLEKALTELNQRIRISGAEHEDNLLKFSNSFNKEANQVFTMIQNERQLIDNSHARVEDLIGDVMVKTKVGLSERAGDREKGARELRGYAPGYAGEYLQQDSEA